jgi:hypothetical protein
VILGIKTTSNNIKRLACLLLPFVSYALLTSAQEEPRTVVLHAARSTDLPMSSTGGILGQMVCDENASIYFQTEVDPEMRISSDGKDIVRFRLDSIPDIRDTSGQLPFTRDFVVSPATGAVYTTVRLHDDTYIIKFDRDGKYETKTRLQAPETFRAATYVIVAEERFLVAGSIATKRPRERQPFTAIFDSSGQLVRQLDLKADTKPTDAEPRGLAVLQMETGSVVTLPDGFAYFMRRSSNPAVYVISAAGQLVRTLNITSPTGYRPARMTAADGNLLITFQTDDKDKPKLLFGMYDPIEGHEIARYKRADDVTGALACYSDKQFLFIGQHEGKRCIIHAEP